MAPSPRRRRLHAAGAATSALLADTYLSLTARPLRTSAMVAGIVLGVASATAAVVVADTQRAQIDRRFDAQRSHFVVLLANGDTSHAFPSRRVSEIEALEPVAAAGELSIWDDGVAVSTSPLARTARVPLIGATASGLAAAEVRTVWGIPVRAIDRLPGRSVVWVGVALARRLGIRRDLAQTASIAARPYTVAGLVRDDAGFGYVNDAVVMASALARVRYGPGKTVRFLAHVRPGSAGGAPQASPAAARPARLPRSAAAGGRDSSRRADLAWARHVRPPAYRAGARPSRRVHRDGRRREHPEHGGESTLARARPARGARLVPSPGLAADRVALARPAPRRGRHAVEPRRRRPTGAPRRVDLASRGDAQLNRLGLLERLAAGAEPSRRARPRSPARRRARRASVPSGHRSARSLVAVPAARRRLRLSRRRGSTAARGGASDNDRRLHPHRAMVVDRAGELVPVFCSTPLPSISSAWSILPAFVTSKLTLPGLETVIFAGARWNSVSFTWIVWLVLAGPGEAGFAVFDLPPHPASAATARRTAIGTSRFTSSPTGEASPPDFGSCRWDVLVQAEEVVGIDLPLQRLQAVVLRRAVGLPHPGLADARDRATHLPDRERRQRRGDAQAVLDGGVDDLVRQRRDVAGLEVVPAAGHEARVEHRLVLEERPRRADVRDRLAELLHRPDRPLAVLDLAGPVADDHHNRLAVQLLGDERERRCLAVDQDRHQVVRRVGDPVAGEAQKLPRGRHRPEKRAGHHP